MKGPALLFRSHLAGGLADQAVASLGNFALSIWLARHLSVNDYGVYAIALSFIVFLNTLHQAVVTYPLSVRGAPADDHRYRHLLFVAALLTPLSALLCLPILGGAVTSIRHWELLPLVFGALLAWQLQEVNRRGTLARSHYRAAIASDAVRYLGALGAVIALGSRVTLESTFAISITCSLLAAAPIVWSTDRDWRAATTSLGQEIAAHWRLGAPVLGANLLAALSTQWFLWLLAWRQGPSGSATLVALANIAAIASPVMFGAENILVPEIARLRDSLSFGDLVHLLRRRGIACALLVAPFFVLTAAFPETVLRLFYGHATIYADFPSALRILTAAYASYLASFILGAALRGYRSSDTVFKMQLYPALFGVTLGSLLTWQFGVLGACTASLLAGLLRAGTALYFVLRLREVTARCAVTAA